MKVSNMEKQRHIREKKILREMMNFDLINVLKVY